ncbi:MAG: gamma-glutamyltransferase family protein [Alphaproteobacteria bacterium]|nr:gamma-glutamyltransferase family protein [Alphaproteobacteria bacterium]
MQLNLLVLGQQLLEHAHKKHGKLPWAKLFEPAIRLAEQGFKISQRLHFLLRWAGAKKFSPKARAYFFDAKGNARSVGTKLKNPAYAATLKAIARDGAKAFYSGPIAAEIVAAAAGARNFKGDLTLRDLEDYSVVERPAVCTPYRAYRVCGMGPPSSGGPAIVQILKLLAPFSVGKSEDDVMNPNALHLIAEAEKLAYADRNRYIGDPDFVAVPNGMFDDGYIAKRRQLIDPKRAMPQPKAGLPPGASRGQFGRDSSVERSGTSHISIIDGDGNTVSMTTTIEGAFGSGHWAAGFLLNNELTDFSFRPTDRQGRAIANRVQGGKRPRSTMAPVIVFDGNGEVFAALGSPGGGRIILYVTKALIALIDWKLDAQQATAIANFGSMGKAFNIETGFKAVRRAFAMKQFGHTIRPDLMNSGLHIVVRRGDHLEGAADPRREGRALGD